MYLVFLILLFYCIQLITITVKPPNFVPTMTSPHHKPLLISSEPPSHDGTIDPYDLSSMVKLGETSQGVVYKCYWKGKPAVYKKLIYYDSHEKTLFLKSIFQFWKYVYTLLLPFSFFSLTSIYFQFFEVCITSITCGTIRHSWRGARMWLYCRILCKRQLVSFINFYYSHSFYCWFLFLITGKRCQV